MAALSDSAAEDDDACAIEISGERLEVTEIVTMVCNDKISTELYKTR